LPAQRATLRDTFEGCLCVDCLRAVARGDAPVLAGEPR
jgi:hypothetical protein